MDVKEPGTGIPNQIWGYECILDCADCNERILSKESIETFLKELVELIDMKAYGDPLVVHFAEHDPSKAGFTAVQLIETSSITGHFVDETRTAWLNVFSCKDFDAKTVANFVKEFFGPSKVHMRVLERKVPFMPGINGLAE